MHMKILLFCGCLIWTAAARGTGSRQTSKKFLPQSNDERVLGREALKPVTEAPLNLQIPSPEVIEDVANGQGAAEHSEHIQNKFPTDNEISEATALKYPHHNKTTNANVLNKNNKKKNNKNKEVKIVRRQNRHPTLNKGNKRIKNQRKPNNKNKRLKHKNNRNRFRPINRSRFVQATILEVKPQKLEELPPQLQQKIKQQIELQQQQQHSQTLAQPKQQVE